jgi:hypothetical protein
MPVCHVVRCTLLLSAVIRSQRQQLHAVVSGVTVTDLAAASARTQPNTSRYIVTKELFFHSE